jgi:prolyl oligopeptidase
MIQTLMAVATSAAILAAMRDVAQAPPPAPVTVPHQAPSVEPRPPVAPVRPVSENYFAQTVVDPYRWMEKPDNPELAAWMKGQDQYTRSVLVQIPGRDRIAARVRQLDNAGTSVGAVMRMAGRYFYYKVTPDWNNRKLYMRIGIRGRETLLVDPETLTAVGRHYSIDYYSPSWDGRYVVCGLSPGGSEESVLDVVDTRSGRMLGEKISRTQFASVSWRSDNRSFFYTRLPVVAAGASPSESYRRARVYLHRLGADPAGENAVFGFGVDPAIPLSEDDFPFVYEVPGSPWVIGAMTHGVQNEMSMWVSRKGRMAPGSWKKIIGADDAVTDFGIRGDALYLLTHKNAPHFKITRTSLQRSNPAGASVVVPASSGVITAMALTSDALYVRKLEGGLGRLWRKAFSSARATRISTPFDGAIGALYANPEESGALILMASWTQSPQWLAFAPSTGKLSNTGLYPPSPVDFSSITSEEVQARSADGTMIPLSIVRKKDFAFDGSHPTWLMGYGAYGLTIDPTFSPTRLTMLERGAVLAFAHVRGGGEFGEEWHRGGMQSTKMNTIADFIACAEYLIEHKYTAAAHLAGEGASAGGITIGGAITKRPELFAAALIRVGDTNALRSEVMPSGPSNIPEFGTFTTEEGFKSLYAMDAYQHVVDGTPYPAVLLTTGVNDPRVAPWQAAKMAARLQAATSSGRPILLRIDYDAGHGMGSTKSQRDEELADIDAFLLWQLGDPEFQP